MSSSKLNDSTMIKHHIRVAFRNLLKYPGYSFLNLAGLTIGISSAFVLLLYAYQESNYDRHFQGSRQIFRIATDFFNMGGFANSQEQLLDVLPGECPDIESATRVKRGFQELALKADNRLFKEPNYFYTDSAYFQVFSYPFLEGSPATALTAPGQVVLSEDLAKKYFTSQGEYTGAVGKTLEIGQEGKVYKVTGVVSNREGRTHLVSDLWLPIYDQLEGRTGWTNCSIYNYVRLHPDGKKANLERALEDVRMNWAYPASQSDVSYQEWARSDQTVRFFVQPLRDIYLHSDLKFEIAAGGNPLQVYILGAIGLFIVLIAGVNYVNLATARASGRVKEIGVKKTLGAGQRTLIGQFLVESLLFSAIAFAAATGVAELLGHFFGKITGSGLSAGILADKNNIAALAAFSLLVGLTAGVYPAFYLSTFRPEKILKGIGFTGGRSNFRNGLVVVQFAIASTLIFGAIVVYRQLRFIQETDKGFQQEGVLIIDNAGKLEENARPFRQEMEKMPQVARSSFSNRIPAGNSLWMRTFQTPEMTESATIQVFPVDADYLDVMGMRLVAGRNFSADMPTDSSALILNEAAVRELGLEDPVGARINGDLTVIGVVRDFNYQSLRQRIAPAILVYSRKGDRLALKLSGSGISDFLAFVQKTWKALSPEEPINYYFLDENFEQLALKEKSLSKAVSFFTALALFIACLGLFGLAAFSTEQRTKEIGIRKVLGASVAGIVGLLSRDFLKWVGLAVLIASPVAWWGMNRWLQEFAFRIRVEWWNFALVAGTVIVVAFLTVSFQSIRAALINPAASLKTE